MIARNQSSFGLCKPLGSRGVVYGAVVSCVQVTRRAFRTLEPSNAGSFRGLQLFAAPLISASAARLFGLLRRRKTSPRSLAAAFARRLIKYLANKSRRCVLRRLFSIKCLVAISGALLLAAPAHAHHHHRLDANGNIVGHRPHGCPTQFCGCAASLFLFGRIIPELNLAANWLRKFPRTSPAPMMAAARRGHVFVLLRHIKGDVWFVRDGNSGRHLTREHARSIRGFVIVDPHERYAGVVQ